MNRPDRGVFRFVWYEEEAPNANTAGYFMHIARLRTFGQLPVSTCIDCGRTSIDTFRLPDRCSACVARQTDVARQVGLVFLG